MNNETLEITEVLSPEKKIEQALASNNVTANVIAKLKEDYLPLSINGIDDVEGYKAVDEARKVCKKLRNLAENICKTEREPAIAYQKAVIAKEKEITSEISVVEKSLEAKQAVIDHEKEQLKLAEAKRIEDELNAKIEARANQLLSYGVTGDYNTLKFSTDDQFALLLEKAKVDFHADELRKEQLRIAQEAEAKKLEEQRLANEAEAKRLQAIADEQKKANEAEALRLQKIADEQAANQAKIDAENARIEQEKQAAIDAENRAKEAAIEEAKKAQAEAERIQREIEHKEREEKIRPDKEKLESYFNSFQAKWVELTSNESTKLKVDFDMELDLLVKNYSSKIQSL